MPAIAPWENPDLPAPFATVEREIEGRARQFALWRWENRIVWRDLRFRQLWWATLDVAASLDDWERAIKNWAFGRALSQSYKVEGRGPRFGLPRRVQFKPDDYGRRCKFIVVSNSFGRGIARQKDEDRWWPFPAVGDNRPLRRIQQGLMKQPLWWPGLQIPQLSRAVWSGYSTQILSQLPPHFLGVLRAGENAEILLLARDIILWHHLSRWPRHDGPGYLSPESGINRELLARLPKLFELPDEMRVIAIVTDWPFKVLEIGASCQLKIDGLTWSVQRWEKFPTQAPTAERVLELRLRLRDALRPILTATEIAEILGA